MESLLTGIKKNVPIDVLIQIILRLPGSSVVTLCSTNKLFRYVCKKYEDRIFSKLIQRDNFKKYPELNYKNSYLRDFIQIGQPYILDVFEDKKCGYTVGKIARIPQIGDIVNRGKDKAVFYIDSLLYKDLSIKDFDKGTKYWVFGILGENNVLNVSLKKSLYAVPLPGKLITLVNKNKLKTLFPNNWEEIPQFDNYQIYNNLMRILKRDKCFLYINDGTKVTYFIKQIILG